MRIIDHFIAGESSGGGSRTSDVFNPNDGSVQAQVPLGDAALLDKAVAAAHAAQPEWAATNPQRRARVFFKFKELVEADMENLAEMLSSEHGKVIADSRGDVQRGLDVIEFCCGIPHVLKGEYTQGAGPGIDVYSMRQPLGIGAGITPFNFPAMIPMWMFGPAIAAGNAFILKPSERDPSVPRRLAELFLEAGAPEGILQVVQGDKEMVDAILDHPAIGGVSFVGSSDIAHYVYQRGVAAGKRVQAMGGAKNHGIVMPDADLDQVVSDLSGAAYRVGRRALHGTAGGRAGGRGYRRAAARKSCSPLSRRCASVSPPMPRRITALSSMPRTRSAWRTGSRPASTKARSWSSMGAASSCRAMKKAFSSAPACSIMSRPKWKATGKKSSAPCCRSCGPRAFDEAVALPSKHQYGNGVAIFTRNGHAAREFAARVNVGMVGINVPIPVPVAYHSFGGWKRSAFGDTNQHGMEGVKFWTKVKTITQRWPDGTADAGSKDAFVIPTMG